MEDGDENPRKRRKKRVINTMREDVKKPDQKAKKTKSGEEKIAGEMLDQIDKIRKAAFELDEEIKNQGIKNGLAGLDGVEPSAEEIDMLLDAVNNSISDEEIAGAFDVMHGGKSKDDIAGAFEEDEYEQFTDALLKFADECEKKGVFKMTGDKDDKHEYIARRAKKSRPANARLFDEDINWYWAPGFISKLPEDDKNPVHIRKFNKFINSHMTEDEQNQSYLREKKYEEMERDGLI